MNQYSWGGMALTYLYHNLSEAAIPNKKIDCEKLNTLEGNNFNFLSMCI